MAQLRATCLHRYLVLPTLLAAALGLRSATAAACSYALQAIEVSHPAPDANNVPTNAVLFVDGRFLDPETIRVLDASGVEVSVEVLPAEPGGFDVRPLAPLDPGRRYQLLAADREYMVSNVVAFTTGSGPAASPEHMEAPELAVTVLQPPPGQCGPAHSLCVPTTAPPGTSLEVRVDGEMLRQFSAGGPLRWFGSYGLNVAPSACVEVRLRDVRGRRSAPRTLCGAEAARLEVASDDLGASTCESQGALIPAPDLEPSQADTAVPASSTAAGGDADPRDVTLAANDPERVTTAGCQLTGTGASRASAGLLGLGLLGLLSARRRRA